MIEQGPYAVMDQADPDQGESEGIDLERVREIVGFALRAARRRSWLAAAAFVSVAGIGLTVSATMPRTYSSQVKLLARRSPLIRPNSQNGPEENPTKNVSAMIMRRDNLVQLAKEENLLERTAQTRSAALRFKDRVLGSLYGATSDADKLRMLVMSLEGRLTVEVEKDDATVDITIDWPNPQIAYDLVTRVQKNFLELRYDSDVAAINDSVAVLEEHAKSELAVVDADLAEYQKILEDRAANAALHPPAAVIPGAPVPRGPVAGGAPPRLQGGSVAPGVDSDLAKALEEKRLQIKSAEEGQSRALEVLRAQLVQAQLTLTSMHPTVIALQQQVDAMSQPSAELTRLRAEERALLSQIAAPRPVAAVPSPFRTGPATDPSLAPSAAPAVPLAPQSLDRDGPLQIAQAKLTSAVQASEEAMARVDQAKEELEFTRAAYKYRYSVFTPAEVSSKPKKPTATIVGVGSVFGAGLLAILLAAASDLATGLVLESWQVRRQLKLEVLGEFDRPA
jgi:hypothetical protein